jgi:uncharacterized protein involved in copper resistance
MTREDIIHMAHKVGLHLATDVNWMPVINLEYAEAFAKLVAQHERKECEKIIWDADAWIGSDAKIWIVKSIQEARGQA